MAGGQDTGRILAGVLITICMGLATFALTRSIRDGERLAVIESNRFTWKDRGILKREIMEELPPEWLRKIVDELKASSKTMESRLRDIEKAVVELKDK